MKLQDNRLTVAVRVALSVGAFVAAGSAFAQDSGTPATEQQAKKLETITVTGSRIRSVDVETSQPVFTMTQADIQKTGLVSAGDVLNHLTVAAPSSFGKASVLASNSEQGGQYLNMRNLGENRVLILVNGKRWATSVSGIADVSNIPVSMIERVDVLKDGASAVYGSDAIAGVVNFVLKDHYNGAEATSYVGQNEKGDGTTQQYSFTVGTSGEKASIMLGVNYNKQDTVWANNRSWTNATYGPNHVLDGTSATGPWGRFLDEAGNQYVLNHTGTYDGIGVGADSRDISNYHSRVTANDRYNATQQMMLAIPSELKSVFTSAKYDFNENVSFRTNVMYSERDSKMQVAGYPLNSGSQASNEILISKDSYYNPLGSSIAGNGAGQDLYFYRRVVETPRITENNAKTYHFDGAFEGVFNVGTRNWNWDVGFNYNKYDGSETGTGNINLSALQSALGPSFLNAAGQVQCGTAASPIPLGTAPYLGQCTPFNILGGPSASTSDALKYISTLSHARQSVTDKEYTANIGGGLFDLPAGEVAFAAGVEHRNISGYDEPDQMSAAGLTTDLAGGATYGGYNTNEAYAELNVPVLKDLPGAQELSFDVATRYSHYSNFGSTTNNKYSFVYKPFADLLIRGTYAKGFRAPTIGDTAGGGSQSFDSFMDPCDSKFGQAATNGTIKARCAAAGLPANFRQLDNAGEPVASATQGLTAFNAGVGNTNLKPEYATNRTLGAVYSPSWLEGFDISLDWYKIRIDNVITAIGAQTVLDNCYVQNDPTYCSAFTRDGTTGQVSTLNRGNTNLGWVQTEGYDLGTHYRLPEFAIGKFSVNLDLNYLKAYDQRSGQSAPVESYAGTWSYPRVRANLGLDWTLGDWGATWGLRYYGAYRDQCWDADAGIECNQPNYTSETWGTVGANRKGATVINDAQVRWQAPWNGSISLGVNNIFKRRPQVSYSAAAVNSSSPYDPTLDIDRYWYLSYTQKF